MESGRQYRHKTTTGTDRQGQSWQNEANSEQLDEENEERALSSVPMYSPVKR